MKSIAINLFIWLTCMRSGDMIRLQHLGKLSFEALGMIVAVVPSASRSGTLFGSS